MNVVTRPAGDEPGSGDADVDDNGLPLVNWDDGKACFAGEQPVLKGHEGLKVAFLYERATHLYFAAVQDAVALSKGRIRDTRKQCLSL